MSEKAPLRLKSFQAAAEREGNPYDPRWYCLKTIGAHFDAVAAASLAAFGMPVLFPRIRKGVALFTGYVFAEFDLRYFRSLGYVHGVATLVGTGGRPAEVGIEVIEEIRSRIGNDGYVKLDQSSTDSACGFKEGDRIEIIDGLFTGFKGAFLAGLSNDERLQILLESISESGQYQQVKVEIERAMIAKLPSQDCRL